MNTKEINANTITVDKTTDEVILRIEQNSGEGKIIIEIETFSDKDLKKLINYKTVKIPQSFMYRINSKTEIRREQFYNLVEWLLK